MKMKLFAFEVAIAASLFAMSSLAEDAYWTYAGGTITDGVWTFNATVVSDNKMTVGTCVTYPGSVSLLDFSKPVKDADDNVYTIKALNTAMVTFSRSGGRPGDSSDKGMAAKVGELRLPATGLTSIGEGAFCRTANCTNVVNYLPDSVTSIGNSAFAFCGAKRDLFLRGFSGSTGRGIFYSCGITSITFGPGFKGIGDTSNTMASFQSCSSITNVVFDPAGANITLSADAFRCGPTLKQPLVLYGVKSVASSAFTNWKIPSITFDNGIQSIGTLTKVTTLTEVRFLGAPPTSQTGTFADYNQGTTATVKTYIPHAYRQQWWQYADGYDPAMTDAQKERLIQYDPLGGTTFSSTYASTPAKRPLLIAEKSWIVAFVGWDGAELGATTVLDGEDATPPAVPLRENYHFTGWSGSYQNVQASATLTAQYAINTYTVRFLDYDGTVIDSQTIDHGASATPPANPTREGWRFIGWSDSYECVTSDKDITAIYADDSTVTHIVTFKDWDGTEISRQEIVEGASAILPVDPSRTGWHFTGWSGNYANVQQDETVTATYEINTYEITFQDWDGTVLKVETVDYGSDATPPANPDSRTGWHFTGWSGACQNVQAAATVIAQYEINVYTVRFKYEDGTVVSEQQIEYLGSATAPANPAPLDENTVFYKWSCDFSSITSDLEVVAMFVNKVVEIDTGAKFAEFMASSLVINPAVTFALTSDISLLGVTYTKPDTFAATLDGRGHTIRDFPSDANIKSLCNTLTGTIRDLTIADYTSPNSVGLTSILAGKAQGATVSGVVLTNCLWTVPNANQGTAGLIYETESPLTTITNCTMVNCKVLGVDCGGSSNGEPQLLGGFVAKASDLFLVDCNVIVDNTNELAIGDGISVAGALVGKCGNGVTIMRCSNNARVAVNKLVVSTVGGAGGLVGILNLDVSDSIITNCANFGKVESTVNYPAGGLVGDALIANVSGVKLTQRSNFNYGDVSSPMAAGGHLGRFRGARNLMVNHGNSGSISSPSGAAGGIVGLLGHNTKSKSPGFRNVMQAGAISTESGFAGMVVGGLTGSTISGCSLVVSNAYLAGSVTATGGGSTGLVFAGRDTAPSHELKIVIGKSEVLASNASLPLYSDNMSGEYSVVGNYPDTFAASALINKEIFGALNKYATKNKHAEWIQGEEYPEILTFGKVPHAGLILLFY